MSGAAATQRLVQIHRRLGLAKKPKKKLPRQVYPKTIEAAYQKGLLNIVDHVRATLIPLSKELPSLLASAVASRRMDANEGRRAQQLIEAARSKMADAVKPHQVEDLARSFAAQTASYQRVQLGRQVHAALGVDVPFTDPKLKPMTEHFVSENVSLIKSIPHTLHDDVEQMVTRAVANGTLHSDLEDQIASRFGVAQSDAARIARDQIGKFYGQVNHARQREIGITRFIWRTVGDQRVRDEHDELQAESESEPFRFDDPPETDDGPALPGQPIQCRCYAEPVFEDLDMDDDDSDDDDSQESDDESDDDSPDDDEQDDDEDR